MSSGQHQGSHLAFYDGGAHLVKTEEARLDRWK